MINFGFWRTVKTAMATVYTSVMIKPLRRLYFDGPHFYGYGFWRGAAAHDICAHLTTYDSKFWLQHPQACREIIERDFYSIVVFLETLGYFLALYLCLKMIYNYVSRRKQLQKSQ